MTVFILRAVFVMFFYATFYEGIKTGEEGGGSEAAGQAMERKTGGFGWWRIVEVAARLIQVGLNTSFTFHLKNTKQVYTTNNVYQELLK